MLRLEIKVDERVPTADSDMSTSKLQRTNMDPINISRTACARAGQAPQHWGELSSQGHGIGHRQCSGGAHENPCNRSLHIEWHDVSLFPGRVSKHSIEYQKCRIEGACPEENAGTTTDSEVSAQPNRRLSMPPPPAGRGNVCRARWVTQRWAATPSGNQYPSGFMLCQRQLSAHIASRLRCADQPSSAWARLGSA